MNSLESFVKFIPSANNPSLTLTIASANILTDLESKSKRFTGHLNDTLYEVSNEPSLGLYRIQEHVRKSIPKLSEKNDEMIAENAKIQGAVFDLDYSLEAIVKMVRADTSFDAMNRLLLSSLNAAKQINHRNARLAASQNEAKRGPAPRLGQAASSRSSSVPQSPRITTSASVILNESRPTPTTPSNTSSSNIPQLAGTGNNTPTSKGFFSSFLSPRTSRTSSISEQNPTSQPAARSSAQRSQTMLISSSGQDSVDDPFKSANESLAASTLVEEPKDAESDLSNADPPAEH